MYGFSYISIRCRFLAELKLQFLVPGIGRHIVLERMNPK